MTTPVPFTNPGGAGVALATRTTVPDARTCPNQPPTANRSLDRRLTPANLAPRTTGVGR